MREKIKDKMNNKQVSELVQSVGVGNAVSDALAAEAIEDKLLKAMWSDAQERLWAIRRYLRGD